MLWHNGEEVKDNKKKVLVQQGSGTCISHHVKLKCLTKDGINSLGK